MTARAALRAAWGDLWRWPLPTALALLTALTATLVVRAGSVRAHELVALAGAEGSGQSGLGLANTPGAWTALSRALALVLAAHALRALMRDMATAIALSAYGGPPPPAGTRTGFWPQARLGVERTPAMITIRALELLIYYALGVGSLFVLVGALRHAGSTAARQLLAPLAALALAPGLALALYTLAAARVAQALVARGLPAAAALVHGLDWTYRHAGLLARLVLATALVTAPLALGAALLPAPLGAPLWALGGWWAGAGRVRLVGADGRLRFG